MTDRVLVVPLEGVLCRTDVGQERRVQRLSADPLAMLTGARHDDVLPPEALPLNPQVLEGARAARDAGRQVVLLTGEDAAQAQTVAKGMDLFDDVLADVAARDRDATLAARYPEGYELAQAPPIDAGTRRRAQVKALRPHQWSKNLLVFLPMLAAHDASQFGAALAAFLAFSFTASSVYILNDISDLAADRAHKRKRNRPFAAGVLSVGEGVRMAAGLILLAVALALLFTPPLFLGVLAFYYAATFAYSLWLKRKLVVDVIMLAGLYTLRIIAGGVACGVPLSPWMLGFSMFLFLSLAAVKRQAELTDMAASGLGALAGRAYAPDDLPVIRSMALSAGYAAVLVFALYISSADVTALYSSPETLWLVCPVLLYWISRMVMKAHRGQMTDDPIVFAATDKVSLGVTLLGACIFYAAGAL